MTALESLSWSQVYSVAFVEAWKESKDPGASADLAATVADEAIARLRTRTHPPDSHD